MRSTRGFHTILLAKYFCFEDSYQDIKGWQIKKQFSANFHLKFIVNPPK